MVKVILFDFWGTLVENGVWSPIKQVKNILGIKIPFSKYVTRMESAMMTQPFSSLKEAFEAVCGEFKLLPDERKIESLIGMWNKSWMLAKPYEEVKEVLTKLKENHKLVLISNGDSIALPKVLEKFELDKYFDEKFFSFEVGLIKTDKKFLELVLNKLEVTADDCLLVGDSIQSDMVAAEKAWIKAVLVDRRNTRNYRNKIKNLREI
jgi:HAD superfamily hydrolase (TIGR01549 family)